MDLRVGNRARHILLALAVFFPISSKAWAWGDEGHKIVCEVAMRLAVPSARAEIRRLIKTDSEFNFFSDSCTWPDHPRKRAAEHFINLARDSSGLASNMLTFGRIYSRESESDLDAKFTSAGVRLVAVTPPDADIRMTINADAVRQVNDASSGAFGTKARSLLVFLSGPHLTDREAPSEIRQILGLPATGPTRSA